MYSSYHTQLAIAWVSRCAIVISLLAIVLMVTGCSHNYTVEGTSSGSLTRDTGVAGSTQPK